MTTASKTETDRTSASTGRIGDSPLRPDGRQKVTGEFAYSSDLWHEDMCWGVTLRSPHPHARIRGIDVTGALAVAGVVAVCTADDVPGLNRVGLEHLDQPCLAEDVVRYQGEPVALVAADHPETARRAARKIVVDYEVLPAVTDARRALDDGSHHVHPGGNLVREVPVRRGGPVPDAPVVVSLDVEVGMQDQAFLGPESGLAVPDGEGGVDLYVATQWLHVDQQQVCRVLGIDADAARLHLAGVGGAFGGREDLSVHVHACLLALRTGKPVKMSYARDESFFGHVHRHPAWLRYEFGAEADGTLRYGKAEILFDGGAYASSTGAVVGNGGTLGLGPYRFPVVDMVARGVYTNNPPCGAMRGFGCVQAAFAHEALMDELAARVGVDPLELRARNGMRGGRPEHHRPGDRLRGAGGGAGPARAGHAAASRAERRRSEYRRRADTADLLALPGGAGNTTHGEGVRRGVGYAVTYKNVGFSEGFDDYSTARVRLSVLGGEPVASVRTAAAEVGQGLVSVEAQIARTELGVTRVVVDPKDTSVGSGGSTSASRQTYVTGGAVRAACEAVRTRVLERAAALLGPSTADLVLDGDKIVAVAGTRAARWSPGWPTCSATRRSTRPSNGGTARPPRSTRRPGRATRTCSTRSPPTAPSSTSTSSWAWSRWSRWTPRRTSGTRSTRTPSSGRSRAASAQGMGLALMEEVLVDDGMCATRRSPTT